MIAIPLRLVGCNIYDADDNCIALIQGEMAEYRERGADIVAAVNGFAKLPDLLEGSVREAIKHPLASLDKFEEHYARLRESHADLLAAAKAAKASITTYDGWSFGDQIIHLRALKAAIAKAEEA